MKTREQWVEEVMEQADCYAKSFMCEVLARSNLVAALPANAVKNMEHENLRALLLEVPDPIGWQLVKYKTLEEVSAGAEKMASFYRDDKRSGIDYDVANAFYAGFRFAVSPEYKGE